MNERVSTQRGRADYRIDGNGSLVALAGDQYNLSEPRPAAVLRRANDYQGGRMTTEHTAARNGGFGESHHSKRGPAHESCRVSSPRGRRRPV